MCARHTRITTTLEIFFSLNLGDHFRESNVGKQIDNRARDRIFWEASKNVGKLLIAFPVHYIAFRVHPSCPSLSGWTPSSSNFFFVVFSVLFSHCSVLCVFLGSIVCVQHHSIYIIQSLCLYYISIIANIVSIRLTLIHLV